MSILLPLFPLDMVLLPGVPLPLHIFEPRYREMISECLAQEKPFGVVRVKEEGVAEIDRSRLSFHLAGSLPLDLDFKQTLLGMKSESERVQGIISYFETILPGLRRAVRARKRAGGNGHVD